MADEPNRKVEEMTPDPRGEQPKPRPDTGTKQVPAPDAEHPDDAEISIEKKIRAI